METRAHHILIGAFAIVAFLLGAGFVLWLSKTSADREFSYYDVIFNEAVTGLSKGGLVQYNGINVGQVTQLRLDPKDPRIVIARIQLAGDTPVKVDTQAKLGLLGVTGTAFIQLSGGKPSSKLLLPTDEEPIPRIQASESALSKLMSSGEDIVTSVNQALMRVGQLLSEENVAHVSSTLAHFDSIANTIADQREELATALKQLADASGELKSTLGTIDRMAKTTDQLIDGDLRRVIQSTDKAIDAIDQVAGSAGQMLDRNQAAINNFSEGGLRQVGPTLIELRETLDSLKQLSDKLGNSNSLLLGNRQPREFKPE